MTSEKCDGRKRKKNEMSTITCRLTETARLLKNVKSVFTRRSNAASRVNVEVELSRKSSYQCARHLSSFKDFPLCNSLLLRSSILASCTIIHLLSFRTLVNLNSFVLIVLLMIIPLKNCTLK